MPLVDRYLAAEFLRGMVPILLLLGGLLSFVGLAEQLEDVGRGTYTTLAAVQVVLLTLPRVLIDILPVTVLLGALIGLGRMANQRELVAMRAAGMPPWRLAQPLLLVVLALIVVVHLGRSHLIPGWERQALQLRAATVSETSVGQDGYEYWTRADDRLLRVGRVLYGRIPTEIEIYHLDEQDRLSGYLLADRADLIQDREWVLHEVVERELGEDTVSVRRLPQMVWHNTLSPAQLASLIQPAQTLAPADLRAYIRNLEHNRLNAHQYRFVYWQMLSLPVAMAAMALLAVPFVLGSLRSVPIGQRVALGGGLGLAFYLLEQVIGHLAVLYRLDPIVMAMGPEAILLTVAAWALSQHHHH